jgi:hypothetical protein
LAFGVIVHTERANIDDTPDAGERNMTHNELLQRISIDPNVCGGSLTKTSANEAFNFFAMVRVMSPPF